MKNLCNDILLGSATMCYGEEKDNLSNLSNSELNSRLGLLEDDMREPGIDSYTNYLLWLNRNSVKVEMYKRKAEDKDSRGRVCCTS